jgi:RNA polymerase sigma-70 factor (ECF subfamily)
MDTKTAIRRKPPARASQARNRQEFFMSYWRIIYRFAKECGLSDIEAEDVLHRVIDEASSGATPGGGTQRAASLSNQLRTLTQCHLAPRMPRSSAAGAVRAGPPRRLAERASALTGQSLAETWDRDWHRNRLQACLDQVRREVDGGAFRAFELHALDGWSAASTAEFLQMSEGNVYLAKSRVIQRIRELMDANPDEDGGSWIHPSRTSI